MKFPVSLIAANLISITCVVFAGIIATKGQTGWGWFLFCAVVCSASVKVGDNKG